MILFCGRICPDNRILKTAGGFAVNPAEECTSNQIDFPFSHKREGNFCVLLIRFTSLSEVKQIMASEKILEAKKAKVAQLTEQLQNAVSCVFVDYKGITVEQDTKLRKELREAGVTYFVEKNTMLLRAFKECGIEGFEEALNGTTALAVSNDDQTAPARILGKFAEKAGDEKFNLKAGYVEGEVYDQAGVIALSKIPSKDTLLAQLVGSLQGPLQKLAATLNAVADKKKEEEAA